MKFENKTILVTGATGLIGSSLVFKLIKNKKINVIALSRNKNKILKHFSICLNKQNFSFVIHDISKPLKNLKRKINYIFHAASSHEAKIIKNKPMNIIYSNVLGTLNCLNYLKKQKKDKKISAKLILLSSITVYRNNSKIDLTFNERHDTQSQQVNSLSIPYSESKRFSEIIALSYARQFNVNINICRLSTVYGFTMNTTDSAFYNFINDSMLGKNIIIKNKNLPRRDNIYVDDAITGLLKVAFYGTPNEIYNISSNKELNNFLALDEIAKIIIDLSNQRFGSSSKKANLIFDKFKKPVRKPGIILDNSKLKKLGWNLKTNIYEGIKKTIKLYKLKKI